MKSGKTAIVQSMKFSLGWTDRAKFNHKTLGVILNYLCLRVARDRDTLRNSARTRTDLYFDKGLEKLNKEADISYIIRHVRILRFFLKTVLSKDMRILLKLKSAEFITSDEDVRQNTNRWKKKSDKVLLLERYVENLQRKNLSKQDTQLLHGLGFKEALELLTKFKKKK